MPLPSRTLGLLRDYWRRERPRLVKQLRDGSAAHRPCDALFPAGTADGVVGPTTTMTLHPHEFIRRFLQHVPPRGFHRARYYGLWSAPSRTKLRRLQLALGARGAEAEPGTSDSALDDDAPAPRHPLEGETCPHCGKGRLVYVKALPPRRDIPP